MSDKSVFTEKQYLGREFIPLTIRLVLAMFCFAAYFFTDERERNGDLLVVVGFAIIIISIILGFLLHFRTRVENKSVMLDGLWTTKLVKIDLNSIVKAEKGTYSRYLFNNPVYNLHTKGVVKFYTSGDDFIELKDKDGFTYRVGTRRPNELYKIINKQITKFNLDS